MRIDNLKKVRAFQLLNPTPFEKMFKYRLQKWGIHFQEQFIVINAYIADFYLPQYKLIIEIDGAAHYTHGLKHDKKRDEKLRFFGYKVLRIRNTDVADYQKEDLLQSVNDSYQKQIAPNKIFFNNYLSSLK